MSFFVFKILLQTMDLSRVSFKKLQKYYVMEANIFTWLAAVPIINILQFYPKRLHFSFFLLELKCLNISPYQNPVSYINHRCIFLYLCRQIPGRHAGHKAGNNFNNAAGSNKLYERNFSSRKRVKFTNSY